MDCFLKAGWEEKTRRNGGHGLSCQEERNNVNERELRGWGDTPIPRGRHASLISQSSYSQGLSGCFSSPARRGVGGAWGKLEWWGAGRIGGGVAEALGSVALGFPCERGE